MIHWLRGIAQARWKRAAEAVLAPVHYKAERERMAAGTVARLLKGKPEVVSLGSPAGSDLLAERRLRQTVSGMIEDSYVRVSLALRHLAVLSDAVATSDYEDAGRLLAEEAWKRRYFEERLELPLPVYMRQGQLRDGDGRPEVSDEWCRTLDDLIEHQLRCMVKPAA